MFEGVTVCDTEEVARHPIGERGESSSSSGAELHWPACRPPGDRGTVTLRRVAGSFKGGSDGFIHKRHQDDGRPAASRRSGIYYAEQQIMKALPKMIDLATNRDLATGLKSHLEETQKQIERLQKAFAKLGKEPSGTQCPAIDGIIKEANETAGEIEDKAVLDAAIVANSQAVEHYEMCRYGTLIAWAEESVTRISYAS